MDDDLQALTPTTTAVSAHDDPELAAHLRLVIMRLARQLRSQTVAGLSPSLISALVTIERKGPLTLGQLAALERVKPPSVTRMVAALEGAGLVRREADPAGSPHRPAESQRRGPAHGAAQPHAQDRLTWPSGCEISTTPIWRRCARRCPSWNGCSRAAR